MDISKGKNISSLKQGGSSSNNPGSSSYKNLLPEAIHQNRLEPVYGAEPKNDYIDPPIKSRKLLEGKR